MSQNSESHVIENILENLFHVLPIVHKKLLRMDMGGVTGNLSRLHMAIMGMLSKETLAVSEVARRLSIPKSQMTHLIDQMVEMGILVRQPDATDRRITNISITAEGRKVLGECKGMLKDTMREKLASLTPAELAEMASALEKLKNIGAKL